MITESKKAKMIFISSWISIWKKGEPFYILQSVFLGLQKNMKSDIVNVSSTEIVLNMGKKDTYTHILPSEWSAKQKRIESRESLHEA